MKLKKFNETWDSIQKETIVSKLEQIELFIYDNPKPNPKDVSTLCDELVEICRTDNSTPKTIINENVDDDDAKKWWNSLNKSEKSKIESKYRTLIITNSNMKRIYKLENNLKESKSDKELIKDYQEYRKNCELNNIEQKDYQEWLETLYFYNQD